MPPASSPPSDLPGHPAPSGASQPGVSVIIPCFNEEANVPLLAQELREELKAAAIESYEVIYVDDGSTDGTAKRASEEVERDPADRFRLLRLAANCGQSSAVEAGIRHARGAILLVMDGDLQNPPADIPKLLAPILDGSADCACGWRATRRAGDGWYRRVQSRIANAVREWLVGDDIHDSGCGFRAFRRECVERVKFYRGMHRFLPTLIRLEGFRVVEIPVGHRPRLHETSKYGMWNRAFAALTDAFAVRWMRSRVVRWRASEPAGE
jgi:dolichol-phosphate mannosyltransferase